MRILLGLFIALVLSACQAEATQTPPTSVASQVVEPAITPSGLPLTEADVPRVSIQEAKAALESGAAVIVDVRSPDDYEASHIAGAISVPLGQIERTPTDLPLPKDQWIITYCT